MKKQSLKSYYAEAESKLRPTQNGQAQSDTVVAPKVWKSSKGHPTAYLVYITNKEAALLAKKDMHGSGVDKEMHFGPGGIPSFQGDGGSGGGDGGGDGGDGGDSGGSDTGADTSGMGVDTSGVDQGMGGYGDGHDSSAASETDTGPGFDTPGVPMSNMGPDNSANSGGGETLFADLPTLAPAQQEVAGFADSGSKQFDTREQVLRRRAQAAGAMRFENDADVLGNRQGGGKRKSSARRVLGTR